MSIQLRNLVLDSLRDFLEFLKLYKVRMAVDLYYAILLYHVLFCPGPVTCAQNIQHTKNITPCIFSTTSEPCAVF